jgi:hypothetical protein
VAVPEPEGLDLCDLRPKLAPWGIDEAFLLFVEDGEIRIKAEVESEGDEPPPPPDGLADFLAAYVPPPPPEPPPPYVPTYAELRREAYDAEIPIGDQLDALAKGLDGPEWEAVCATRADIKARFPKTTE